MKIYQLLFSLSLERLLPALVQVGVHLFLAQQLGPIGYQPLAVLALIVQLSFPLIDLTLSQSIMVKKWNSRYNPEVYSNISLIIWVISILICCLVIVLSTYYTINIVLAISYVFVIFGQGQTVLQRTNLLLQGKIKELRNIQLKSSFCSVIIFVFLITLKVDVLISFSLYIVSASMLQIYLTQRADKYYPPKWSGRRILIPLAKLSASLIFISSLAFIFENYLAFYVQNVGFKEVVISTLFLTRRFWGIAAIALADPVERIMYISEERHFDKRIIGVVLVVAVLGPLIFYLMEEQTKNIMLCIIGSDWDLMSKQLLAGAAYVFIFPVQGFVNFVLKTKEKESILIVLEILKRVVLICLLLVFSQNIVEVFRYQYVISLILILITYVFAIKWK